jgi:hypothetical protein
MRIRYVKKGRITASNALIGAFDDGFAVRPVVFLESDKVFAQWAGSVNGNRGPVTMFNYRAGSWSVGFEGWARYLTLKERTQPFAISDAQAIRGFQVQAVFSNGSVGPWVTAVPQS